MSLNDFLQRDKNIERLQAEQDEIVLRLVRAEQQLTSWEHRRPQVLRYMQALGPLIR